MRVLPSEFKSRKAYLIDLGEKDDSQAASSDRLNTSKIGLLNWGFKQDEIVSFADISEIEQGQKQAVDQMRL